MTTIIQTNNIEIQIVTEYFNSKISADGGAAPWMIGRTVKSSKTSVFVNGDYQFDFPFNHKIHKKGGIGAKNQLQQILSYLN